MKNEILSQINHPGNLEKLYRANKQNFKRTFNGMYAELKGNPIADFWYERLNYTSNGITWGTNRELMFVLVAAVCAGTIAKLPDILHIDPEFFYPRNIGFTVLPILSAFFAWKNKLSVGKAALIFATALTGVIFINSLPIGESDTLWLSCIHLLLVLWAMLGFAFVGKLKDGHSERIGFLSYNGELVVISALILITGGVITGVTIGLFSLIGFNIEEFYFNNIVVFTLPTVPIFGTFLIRTNPELVGKISPVIAKIFSPLVLVMLVSYLIAIAYSGKDPFNDRDFLIIFNALLIGVMAIIFFSISEFPSTTRSQIEIGILFLLSGVTIIVNAIALSAIVFRILEWGITPNRAAVLGGNILIFINLSLVAAQLFKVLARKTDTEGVGKAIATYLPVYVVWTVIVTFLFPFFFGFE